MAEAAKKAAPAVTSKDVAPLTGAPTVVDESAHDALGRTPGAAPAELDASAPVDVKVVDEPAREVPELTEEEQISRYGHALRPDKVFVSEGMRHDLVTYGHAIDPVSGRRVEPA